MEKKRIFLCCSDDIPRNTIKAFQIEESLNVIIFNNNGEFKAFQKECPHQGYPLDVFGVLSNGILVCTAHGLPFCAETGHYKRPVPKCRNLKEYPLVKENSDIFLCLH